MTATVPWGMHPMQQQQVLLISYAPVVTVLDAAVGQGGISEGGTKRA